MKHFSVNSDTRSDFNRKVSRLKSLAHTALVYTLSFTLAAQPIAISASEIRANNAANAINQPQIGVSANGVPQVNIATPNAAGLSHNKYSAFNVGAPGVILNNSNQPLMRSQLGGLVQGNSNLRTSGPASVILNEVQGSSRSVLEGAVEVHGTAADVVIANPNGVTCNGCGFINTPRVTLSTGTPELDSNGALQGLRVEGGDVRIGENGAELGTVTLFDIVSRQISIEGGVRVKGDLNLIAGRNAYAYQTGLITPLDSDGEEPAVAIDSSLLGGMYAGAIKVISTEKGAGVNMRGQMAAHTGGMTLTADGKLVMGKVQAKQQVVARSVRKTVRVENSLFSDDAVVLHGLKGVELADGALVAARNDVTLKGETVTLGQNALAASGTSSNGNQTATGILRVEAETLDAGSGQLAGGGLLSIAANTLDLSRAEDTGTDTLRSLGATDITASTIHAAHGRVSSAGNLTLRSADALSIGGGLFATGSALLVEAGNLQNSADFAAQSTATFRATAGDLVQLGDVSSAGRLRFAATGNLANSGTVVSLSDIVLDAGGSLANTAIGLVAANESLAVTAGNGFINAGTLNARDITVQAGSVNHSGDSAAYAGHVSMTSAGDTTLGGTVSAKQNVHLTTAGNASISGDVVAENTAMVNAADIQVTGLVNGAQGLTVRAATLSNAGEVGSVEGMLLVELTGALTNAGLLYSGAASDYRIDGTITNDYGDMLAKTDLTITGLSGTHAGSITNISGAVEAVDGNLAIAAESVTNKRVITVTPKEVSREETVEGTTTTTVVTTREDVALEGPAAQLLAGGNITLDTGRLVNSYSQIAANGDITIHADEVLNEGRDLIEAVHTTAVTQHRQRYCSTRIFGVCTNHKTRRWTTTEYDTASSTISAVYGTIEAGGTLNADVTGYITNNAVRGQTGQIGLVSGERALGGVQVNGDPQARHLVSAQSLAVSVEAMLGRSATFQPVAAPNMPYLIETRSAFIEPGKFLGSDYFLTSVNGYDPNQPLKRLGDAYVEYRLIREQIFNLTGTRMLDENLTPEEQVKALYDNALAAQRDLQLTLGVALTPSQIASLTRDIVWMEKQMVQGQEVLVPRVYLAASTMESTRLESGRIAAGQAANLQSAALVNSGAITSNDALTIATTTATLNEGGRLFSRRDITIDAGALFVNRSGIVSGQNVAIGAGGIVNDTAKIRDENPTGFVDRRQQMARIEAQGNLLLQSSGIIAMQGSQLASGGSTLLKAGGDVEITALQLERNRDQQIQDGYDRAYSLNNVLAGIETSGNLSVDAGRNIAVRGADIRAVGSITLEADGSVTIASVQDVRSADMKLDIKTSGFMGVETNIRRQSASVETRRTTLVSGETLDIRAVGGDIALVAPRLQSGGEIRLEAEQGKVALKTTTDQDFAQVYLREEDLLWWNEQDKGHFKETIVHVEMEAGGGLKIRAGEGIIAEYHKTGDLHESLDQIAKAPGMAWVEQLRNDPRVDWKAVEARFEEWDYEAQGLTEVGAALVALVTSFVTAGMASHLSAALSGALGMSGNAAMQAAIHAGVQSLINRTAISLVNNQGDLGKVLKDLGSSDTLRALATAIVTAGLTTHLSTITGLGATLPATAPLQERVAQDIQHGLLRATVRAGVGTAIQGGQLEKNLFDAMRWEASGTLGKYAAEQIGQAWHSGQINKATQLIAHAALGCAVGAVAAGECAAGAAGGVFGELTAEYVEKQLYEMLNNKDIHPDQVEQVVTGWRDRGLDLVRLASGISAALVGGNVDVGAMAGENAAANNAFWIPVIIIAAAYTASAGKGNPLEGLAQIGQGNDPLSKAMAAGTEAAVTLSAEHFPTQTQAVLDVLGAANNAIDATVTYVDDRTGNVVSTRWNQIDPHIRDQIIGASKVVSVLLPAGSVKTLSHLKNASKVPNAPLRGTKTPPQVPGMNVDYDKVSTAKTGQATAPRNLQEQVLWNQTLRDPASGEKLDNMNNDPRFPTSNGWQKMQTSHTDPQGRSISIHYQYNSISGKAYDMKLTNPQRY